MGSIPELEDPLEKEMTTHSSIFAWVIPWTEQPTVHEVARIEGVLLVLGLG